MSQLDVIRVARMEKHEKRAVLLLTPAERKAALLKAAQELQASLAQSLSITYPVSGGSLHSA